MVGPDLFPTSMRGISSDGSPKHVSIIMRTRDRPVLLSRALASVLSQTYLDWEVVLVNDGGDQDEISSILRKYESALAGRLKVIHNKTSNGMEAASNAALRIATGGYIAVHDDDDSWRPNFLHETVQFLENPLNHRFAAVVTNCTLIFEEIVEDRIVQIEWRQWPDWRDQIDFGRLVERNSFPPISLLIRKSVVDTIGSFNRDLSVLGDWEYNLRILRVGDIATISKHLAFYHHRLNQNGPNSNSVSGRYDAHLQTSVLLRNSMIRLAVLEDPGALGILNVLTNRISELELQMSQLIGQASNDNQVKLEHLLEIALVLQSRSHSVEQFLRIPKWIWRKVLPLRRLVARARGHI